MKGDFSRLKGDLSRHTFERLKHYAGVLHQQGRVWLDSDWNDEVLLQLNLLRRKRSTSSAAAARPRPALLSRSLRRNPARRSMHFRSQVVQVRKVVTT